MRELGRKCEARERERGGKYVERREAVTYGREAGSQRREKGRKAARGRAQKSIISSILFEKSLIEFDRSLIEFDSLICIVFNENPKV